MTDFEEIYTAYFRDVELYLLAVCHDAHLAEELTAQAFFQALEALPKFRVTAMSVPGFAASRGTAICLIYERSNPPNLWMNWKYLTRGRELRIRSSIRIWRWRYIRFCTVFRNRTKKCFLFGQLSFADIGSLFGKTQNWACVTYHRAKSRIRDAMEVQDR